MAAYKYLKHTASEVDAAVDSQRQHCEASDLHVCAEDKAALANLVNSDAITRATMGTRCKNLLEVTATSQEKNGLAVLVNADRTITVTGTATDTFSINVGAVKLKAGTYILNGCPAGGSNTTYRLDTFYAAASHHHDLGKGVSVNLSADTNTTIRLVVYPAAGEVNLTFAPMVRCADIADGTYEPFVNCDIDTRLSVLETLSDVIYKNNRSNYATFDTGYVLRVGNQVHLNCTLTIRTACNAWVGGIVLLPIRVKTPDGSTRYTLKQTQADGRETSIYLSNGDTSFYSSTAFKVGDVITIPPMILDLLVKEEAAAATSTSEPTE